MLKMRLQRIGRKNDASFRLIVTDSRRGPKSGKHIDLLGSYNPKLNQFTVDAGKAREWIKKGVQVSDTVHNLLINEKVIEGKKINVLPRKSPIVDEAAAKAAEESTEKAEAESAAPSEGEATEAAPEVESAEEPKEAGAEEAPQEEAEEKTETASNDTNEEASSEEKDEKKAA